MENTSIQELVPLIFTLNRLIREQISGHGNIDPLSLTQLKILAFILEKGNPTMKEIANSLFITLPSATSAINRLVGDHQLKRIADTRDRRIVRLEITDKGKNIYNKCYKDVLTRMNKLLLQLNIEERKEYARILTKIITSTQH